MLVVEVVRPGHSLLVPPVLTRLVAPDQEDGDPSRVKGVENPDRAPPGLDSQLSHVRVAGVPDVAAVRELEMWASNFEEPDRGRHLGLFGFGQAPPPPEPPVGDLYLIFFQGNMPRDEEHGKGVPAPVLILWVRDGRLNGPLGRGSRRGFVFYSAGEGSGSAG